jgi:hypothetical protein
MSDHEESPPPQEHFPIVRAKGGDLAVRHRFPAPVGKGRTVVVRIRARGERRRDFRRRQVLRGMDELRRQQAGIPPADCEPLWLDILL